MTTLCANCPYLGTVGFRSGNPSSDGAYKVLIRWNEGCNVEDENEYSIIDIEYINGTWYDFRNGGQIIDGGLEYEILGFTDWWTF